MNCGSLSLAPGFWYFTEGPFCHIVSYPFWNSSLESLFWFSKVATTRDISSSALSLFLFFKTSSILFFNVKFLFWSKSKILILLAKIFWQWNWHAVTFLKSYSASLSKIFFIQNCFFCFSHIESTHIWQLEFVRI